MSYKAADLSVDDPEFKDIDRNDLMIWLVERDITLVHCQILKGMFNLLS